MAALLRMAVLENLARHFMSLVVAVVAAAALALLPMSLLRAVALLPTAEVVVLLGNVLPLVLTARLVQSLSNNWGCYK